MKSISNTEERHPGPRIYFTRLFIAQSLLLIYQSILETTSGRSVMALMTASGAAAVPKP